MLARLQPEARTLARIAGATGRIAEPVGGVRGRAGRLAGGTAAPDRGTPGRGAAAALGAARSRGADRSLGTRERAFDARPVLGRRSGVLPGCLGAGRCRAASRRGGAAGGGRVRPAEVFDGYALDLDGTVYLGDSLLPGAASTVQTLRGAGAR